jgi:hypothetical protein
LGAACCRVLVLGVPMGFATPREIQADERVIRAYLGEDLEAVA